MSIAIFPYVPAAILVGALGVAGYQDLKTREVPDQIWLILGIIGMAFLVGSEYGSSWPAILLDTVAGLFALQHVIPWDKALGESHYATGVIEGGIYLSVCLLTVVTFFLYRSAADLTFFAIVITVLIARGLFEVRLLYGGADAKAIMISAIVLPFWPQPLLGQYPASVTLTPLPWLPFPLSILIDGTLLTLAVPLWVLGRNIMDGYLSFPESVTLFEIPTSELPRKFVWLRRPALGDNEDVETAEADLELRTAQAQTLTERGIDRVWVTPQLPMVLALAVGAVVALAFGNLLFWLF